MSYIGNTPPSFISEATAFRFLKTLTQYSSIVFISPNIIINDKKETGLCDGYICKSLIEADFVVGYSELII